MLLDSLPPSLPPQTDPPAPLSVSPSPLPNSPPSISLNWTAPSSDCYKFSSHSASCTSLDRTSSATTTVNGDAAGAVVSDLAGDKQYSCVVVSNITYLDGQVFQSTSSNNVSTFSYPDRKPTSLSVYVHLTHYCWLPQALLILLSLSQPMDHLLLITYL